MPVKSVYFQPGHFINIRLECFNSPEMAACVMHEAPDGERGAVLDVAARVISPGSQLVQRSAGIKTPASSAALIRMPLGRIRSSYPSLPSVLDRDAFFHGNGSLFRACSRFPVHLGREGNQWDRSGFSCWRGCGDVQSPWEEVKQSIRPEASKGAERDNRMANITRG